MPDPSLLFLGVSPPDALRRGIAAEALSWVGVAYAHQHREARAVDCLGLIHCVGVAVKVMEPVDKDPRWERFRNYGRVPVPAEFRAGLRMFLEPIAKTAAGLGDVVWFLEHGAPRHLGIIADDRGLVVHADSARGHVVAWRLSRRAQGFIKAAFRYPGLPRALEGMP